MSKPIPLLLVDDHTLVRRGLAALIKNDGRYIVVAEAVNGEEALQKAATCGARLMLLDLAMPGMNGIDVLARLQKVAPALGVCVCSMYDDGQFVAQSLKHGARGYILKQALDDELFAALDAVAAGDVYLSPTLRTRAGLQAEALSPRERELLHGIADGLTTQAIAQRLGISAHTAVRHRASLMNKLSVHGAVDLLRVARERGLLV